MRPPFEPASDRDIAVVSAQLGRPARDVVGIPARCICGNPTVVATSPRLADGTPFPTFYYLTHPAATAAMSQLEATQVMAEFNELLATDETVAAAYAQAHTEFIADRETVGTVPELEGVSAGGMPTRVKCLHALAGLEPNRAVAQGEGGPSGAVEQGGGDEGVESEVHGLP